MAKAREIEGLDCEGSYALAAARVVEVRAGELFDRSNGVLDTSDIEPLHDMRVASRRLRAAMEIFEPCFPRKRFRRTLKQVKALADALGERRDRDVSIAFLEQFSEQVTAPDRRGVKMLADQLRDEQSAANDDLVPYASDERLGPLRDAVAELCDSAREMARREAEAAAQRAEAEQAEARAQPEAAAVAERAPEAAG